MVTVTRRAIAIALLAVMVALTAVMRAQPRTVVLAIGRMAGNETTEAGECYFPIGQGAVLMLHPKGEPCQLARENVGSTG
ncbi:MAG TPA: hypothetical protein VEA16_13980, partial [Vicinamibacterales bacterium]|nr:hypothetical protein [Vicinamibacterales bacterium]